MRVETTIPAVERKEFPKIQEKAKPELLAAIPFQDGYVRAADSDRFRGIDLAVNQRSFNLKGFIEMRQFVDRIPNNVGRFSRDRQSEQYGIADPVNDKLRLEPKPGQQAAVFKESKVAQQLDINAFQRTRSLAIEGAREARAFIKNAENLSKRSYQRTEILLEVTKKAIDILT